ncbi:hypothetical protein G6011_01998 [Alternaria panax]|uniref:Uncharacterized protein n=1 Tax=Alternaria panax TaxID=48097 RepID=A0AAD4FET3_9PLEO|nr:hypothetical protein G6011_01998 [Alternaria panax]
MSATVRADALNFLNVTHDDELPGYDEAAIAPAYHGGVYDEALISYRLQQYDRKIQMLAAYDAPAASYRITTNSFRIFSKKPEMEVLHTSQDMRQRNIAALSYDNDGGFPWRPRAHFDYTPEDGLPTRYKMESLNFDDWSLTVGDKTYVWILEMRPIALGLCEKGSNRVIARFTYSDKGVLALRGAVVGDLTIFRDGLSLAPGGIDKVVCGTMLVVTFFKRMGRNYTNLRMDGSWRVGSVTRDMPLPSLHRGSAAGYSSLGNWAG